MSAENGNMQSATALPKQTSMASAFKKECAGMQISNGLTRLTPARDLTLGGRGVSGVNTSTKKVFLPNLNVIRNKNSTVKTSKDLTVLRGRRGGVSSTVRGNSANVERGSSSLIQTTGVFSEGAGAMNIRRSGQSGSAYQRYNDDPSIAQMRKPVLPKSDKKIDLREEEAQIREILGNSDEEELEDVKTDLGQIPIRLSKWKAFKKEIKMEKPDVPALLSNKLSDESILIGQKLQSHVHQQQLSSSLAYPESVNEFLKNSQSQIFIMQIPDILPYPIDNSQCDETTFTNSESKSQSTINSTCNSMDTSIMNIANNINYFNLFKKIEEGQIGKVVRYKSGKIKLILGETRFDLEMGMDTGFLQELMSVNANRSERSGNMIDLGPIQAKLNAIPDWENLFAQDIISCQHQNLADYNK